MGVSRGADAGRAASQTLGLALARGIHTETAIAFSLAVQAAALTTTLVAAAAALIWLLLRGEEAHTGTARPAEIAPLR